MSKSRYRIHNYRFAGTMPPFYDQAKGVHGQQKPGGSYMNHARHNAKHT